MALKALALPQLFSKIQCRGDHAGNHLVGRATDQRRRDVIAERQDEGEETAGADSGERQREIDLEEGVERAAAERAGGAHIGG